MVRKKPASAGFLLPQFQPRSAKASIGRRAWSVHFKGPTTPLRYRLVTSFHPSRRWLLFSAGTVLPKFSGLRGSFQVLAENYTMAVVSTGNDTLCGSIMLLTMPTIFNK
jgi:hypothetical protein